MTAPELSTVDPTVEPLCSCCAHPTANHDSIATRFCEATQRSALTRGCICRGI
jgi:hypothetical protein